jgi:hypothetical protein
VALVTRCPMKGRNSGRFSTQWLLLDHQRKSYVIIYDILRGEVCLSFQQLRRADDQKDMLSPLPVLLLWIPSGVRQGHSSVGFSISTPASLGRLEHVGSG